MNIISHYIIYTILLYSCIYCPSQKAALNLIQVHLKKSPLQILGGDFAAGCLLFFFPFEKSYTFDHFV